MALALFLVNPAFVFSLAGGPGCLVEVGRRKWGVHLALVILLELAGVEQPLGHQHDTAVHQIENGLLSQLQMKGQWARGACDSAGAYVQ